MLTTAALILIVTSKVVLGQDDRWAVKGQRYKLDMAPDSVDDRYDGCIETMEYLVETKYLNNEITANKSGFGSAWNTSKEIIPRPQDNLSRNHLIAISVYTGVIVHDTFNQDVRTDSQKYKTKTYSWYSLHFWLTRAIQTLKKKQKRCKRTYRGTKLKIDGVKNTMIRFGSFASSSFEPGVAKRFGTESCFEIRTCLGANVTKYSWYPNQKEVLIPPYETFKVTEIRKGKKDDWCKTVFVLKSFGMRSFLNCALAKPMKYHNVIISD